MKYKVGDKVKLVSERPLYWNWEGLMDKYLGAVVEIKEINGGSFHIKDDSYWVFDLNDIVGKAGFTKADLKEGDILTLRNGKKGTYSDDMDISYLKKHHINEDLTNRGRLGEELDIIKVERLTKTEVVYERKEEILDDVERKYLSKVITPFKKRVRFIKKHKEGKKEYIQVGYVENGQVLVMGFPDFKQDAMYRNMMIDKEYTLEELGL